MGKKLGNSQRPFFFKIIKSSIWFSLLSFLNKFGGLFFTIILARFLLPEKLGAFSLVFSVATIFVSLGGLGINQAFIVFFSKSLKKSKKLASSYFSYFSKLRFLLTVLASLILFLLSFFLAKDIFEVPNLASLFMISSLFVLFFSFSSFLSRFFYIYQRVKLDFAKESLYQLIRILFVFLVLHFLPEGFHLRGVFLVLVFSSLISFIFSFIYSRKIARFTFRRAPKLGKKDKKRALSFLGYIIVTALLAIVFADVDILMLGLFVKDLSLIGFYKSAIALSLGVAGIFTFGPLLLPVFSSITKSKKIEGAFEKSLKYTLFLTIPAAVGLIILSSFFLKLFYGPEYVGASLLLIILSFLVFSEPVSAMYNSLFASREKPKFLLYTLIISSIANILLNYVLINCLISISLLWATAGAAIATISTRYLFMFFIIFYSKKNLGVRINFPHFLKSLFSAIFMGIFLYFLSRVIDISIFSGILLVSSGVLIYVLFLFIFGAVNKEDLNTVSSLIKYRKWK